jgi:hypothetical protein
MKTKNLMLILLAIVVSIASCKPERNDPPENTIEYNSTIYNITNGAFIDHGSSNYYGTADTHYDNDFYITDGAFVYNNTGEITDANGKIVIAAYLSSYGTSSFKTGTYTFIDDANDSSLTDAQTKSKYENKYFFTEAIVAISDNNSSLVNANPIFVTSGTIIVEGTKPNYTLKYDLILDNGNTVKGMYNGTFKEAF